MFNNAWQLAIENAVEVIQEILDLKKYFMRFLNEWILKKIQI